MIIVPFCSSLLSSGDSVILWFITDYIFGLGGEEISTGLNSLQFELSTIQEATNKFSDDNKIGEGGFGAVYKVANLCCVKQ